MAASGSGTLWARVRTRRLLALAAAILALPAGAQEELQGPSVAPPSRAWTLAGSLTAIVQNKSVLLQPALTFDRGPLHLESRYNSEDRDTFSLFLGWNLDWGQDLKLQLTPMLGALAGLTKGIAPEIDLTLTWGQFKLSGGAEFLIDFSDTAQDYFSAWSGLTMS